MQNNTITLQAMATLSYNLGNALVKGVTEGDMSNDTALEVGPWSYTLGTVDDLIRDHEIAWLDCLLKTANS